MAEDRMPAPQLQLITDGHEDRIQRVERTQGELAVQVAQNTQQIQHVAENVERGFERMGEKLESCIRPLTEKLDEHGERVVAVAEKVAEHGKALEKIQDEERRSRERWDAWKKWIFTALTGAVAIGLKELVTFIAHRLP